MKSGQEAWIEYLDTLGETLSARNLEYELVCIGGSALLLLGCITRPTLDLDVLGLIERGELVSADPLPPDLLQAARDVAALHELPLDWLNPGPTSLLELGLPEGFMERLVTRRFGSLVLRLPSREDQICLKFYAATDRGPRSKHFADLQRLEPGPAELEEAYRWARTHDPSEAFRQWARQALAALGVEVPDDDG